MVERLPAKTEVEPKALSCYGVLLVGGAAERARRREMLLRFVEGRPLSSVTTAFLAWVCQELEQRGKRVWCLVWDNAPWHVSQEVRHWIAQHNRRVKQEGGVRILTCYLPAKSPWLNPIEPTWLHGKRAIVEADGPLSAEEVIERVCAHYGCKRLPSLVNKTP